MRILWVTLGSLFVSFIMILTVKLWGKSQVYPTYRHPLYTYATELGKPIIFIKVAPEKIVEVLSSNDNLYLDVASTADQKLVLLTATPESKAKPIRYTQLAEIKDKAIELTAVQNQLKSKKLIINLVENAQAGQHIFVEEIKKTGLEKGENFILTSPYEAMAKTIKELAPTLLYGSTRPEILKILAMKSMWLLEAVSFRADIIIHPLEIRNQVFFDETLLNELKRRNKKFIVGPISENERAEAEKLQPFGIIIERP